MKRLQFSILTLLGTVTLAGLGCAALVNASPLWAAIVVSGTVLALLTATLGAFYGQSGARVFCGGFAVFGWAYLVLSTGMFHELEQYFFTGAAHDRLYAAINEPNSGASYQVAYAYTAAANPYAQVVVAQPAPMAAIPPPQPIYAPTTVAYAAPAMNSIDYNAFDRIGHALWAVLLGIVGGVLANCFAGRKREPNAGHSPNVGHSLRE
jgi:hypothetical protein